MGPESAQAITIDAALDRFLDSQRTRFHPGGGGALKDVLSFAEPDAGAADVVRQGRL
jgi:hypothetical protein